jgi:hypothetical protein
MEKKVIQDLNELGHSILYIEDFDSYYVVSDFRPIDNETHTSINELIGKDITDKIANMDANFTNVHTIETMINNTKEKKLKFPMGYKWLWFI